MSGAAAAGAAARAKQLLNYEEEEMTKYSENEINDDWEFKIVRSLTGAFRNPDKLNEAINNEKKYGWILLEKFDDCRLRFKRKKSNENIDDYNNPYQTNYGISPVKFSLLVIFITLFGTGVLVFLIIFITILFH